MQMRELMRSEVDEGNAVTGLVRIANYDGAVLRFTVVMNWVDRARSLIKVERLNSATGWWEVFTVFGADQRVVKLTTAQDADDHDPLKLSNRLVDELLVPMTKKVFGW